MMRVSGGDRWWVGGWVVVVVVVVVVAVRWRAAWAPHCYPYSQMHR